MGSRHQPGRVRIGTSGWSYPHWRGPVYPPDLAPHDFLAWYAERFDTVEVNASFYRLPTAETVAAWCEQVPAGFTFAVKTSRYITHMKKLSDPAASTAAFFDVIGGFGKRLGPVLFQLPPRWRANPGRLDAFLAALPAGHRYVVECRDDSWFTDAVYAVLERHNAAFCLYELAGVRTPEKLTADFVYARLHGPGAAYAGDYDGRTLAGWARRIERWATGGRDVYVYFDNDQAGYAVKNARELQAMVARRLVSE